MHAKRACEDFEINKIGNYNNFYVLTDTLLQADVFNKFRDVCLETYRLDPARFFSLLLQASSR